MNGARIHGAQTLEEKLAAVAVTLTARFIAERRGAPPDYADFRDAFRPFVRVALLLQRLESLDVPREQALQMKIEAVRELLDIRLETGELAERREAKP